MTIDDDAKWLAEWLKAHPIYTPLQLLHAMAERGILKPRDEQAKG